MAGRYVNEASPGRRTWAGGVGDRVRDHLIARLVRVDGIEEWRPAVVVRSTEDAVMVRIAVSDSDPDPYYCWLHWDDVASVVSPTAGPSGAE